MTRCTHTHTHTLYTHSHTHTHIHTHTRRCATPTCVHTNAEPHRRTLSTHYDEDHIEGEMELDTQAQESAGGWMEVQPTSEKPTIPEVSFSWRL